MHLSGLAGIDLTVRTAASGIWSTALALQRRDSPLAIHATPMLLVLPRADFLERDRPACRPCVSAEGATESAESDSSQRSSSRWRKCARPFIAAMRGTGGVRVGVSHQCPLRSEGTSHALWTDVVFTRKVLASNAQTSDLGERGSEADNMKLLVPVALAAMQLVVSAALAQGNNTVDPSQGKARATPATTSQERSAARAERKVEGAEAARGPQIAEGQSMPTARETPDRADRKISNAERRAANAQLNKAGLLPRGGNNQ